MPNRITYLCFKDDIEALFIVFSRLEQSFKEKNLKYSNSIFYDLSKEEWILGLTIDFDEN